MTNRLFLYHQLTEIKKGNHLGSDFPFTNNNNLKNSHNQELSNDYLRATFCPFFTTSLDEDK